MATTKQKTDKQEDTKLSTIPFVLQEKKEEFIICDVCGYANSIQTAICVKCSNYLTEDER